MAAFVVFKQQFTIVQIGESARPVARAADGVVYEIEGPIRTPNGKPVRFCSIWQIDTGTQVPRFITMYPR
jgi:hypothetical protein